MYYYAEYLRGMRALRVIAIILGVLLAIAIVLRLWAFSEHDPGSLAAALQSSPTAHVTTTTLADGTIRTVIDDPFKHVHAVVTRRGELFHMDATMLASEAPRHSHVSIGSYTVDNDQKAGTSHIVINHDMTANIPLAILFVISEVIALVTATMLGGVLAKENDGHLELAWTKPVSRDRLALASMGIDMAAILVSQFAAILLILIVCAMFVWPSFHVNAQTLPAIAIALLSPLAWYAGLTAFSASLKRGLGMVVGLGWLAAIAIPSIEQGTAFLTNDLGLMIHGIFKALTYFDPIEYAHVSVHGTIDTGMQYMSIGPLGTSFVLLLLLTIAYTAAAVLQWRRVEA